MSSHVLWKFEVLITYIRLKYIRLKFQCRNTQMITMKTALNIVTQLVLLSPNYVLPSYIAHSQQNVHNEVCNISFGIRSRRQESGKRI